MSLLSNFNDRRLLLYFLTEKELKTRYRSAKFGFLWAFLNPLIQMIVLSIVFSFFIRLQVPHYPLFLFAGLLPWTFFSLSLTNGTDSLINNRDLIKKVPFPREFLPLSTVLAQLVNFCLSLSLFFVFLILFGQAVTITILFLPLAVLLVTLFVSGLSLLTASLDIYYRDVSFIIQAVVIVWFYLTPVIYPLTFVPAKFLLLYSLNPMVGIISLFHTSLLGYELPNALVLISSIVFSFFFLLLGFMVFKKREPYFADWV